MDEGGAQTEGATLALEFAAGGFMHGGRGRLADSDWDAAWPGREPPGAEPQEQARGIRPAAPAARTSESWVAA